MAHPLSSCVFGINFGCLCRETTTMRFFWYYRLRCSSPIGGRSFKVIHQRCFSCWLLVGLQISSFQSELRIMLSMILRGLEIEWCPISCFIVEISGTLFFFHMHFPSKLFGQTNGCIATILFSLKFRNVENLFRRRVVWCQGFHEGILTASLRAKKNFALSFMNFFFSKTTSRSTNIHCFFKFPRFGVSVELQGCHISYFNREISWLGMLVDKRGCHGL